MYPCDDNDVTPPPFEDDDLPTCTVQLTPPPLQPLRDAALVAVALARGLWDALRYRFQTAMYDPFSGPDAWETYQQWAAGKMNGCEDMQLFPWQLQQVNMAMGLSGEAGETAEMIKKAIFHGHELDRDRLTKELGDVLFYLVSLATAAGIPFQDVVQSNVDKLDARYPAGFSSSDSLNRRDSD